MKKPYINGIQDKRINTIEERMVKISDYYNHQITQIRADIAGCNIKLARIDGKIDNLEKNATADRKGVSNNQKLLAGFMLAMIIALLGLFFK